VEDIPKDILDSIEKIEKKARPGNQSTDEPIKIWNEARCVTQENDSHMIRCCPDERGSGPYYDWVVVDFDVELTGKDMRMPAKLMAFYEDAEGNKFAIVLQYQYC
jgi:hypothetical protein